MRRPIKIAAFADVHHSSYSTGVTAEDVGKIERAFSDMALREKVDFCIFGGDRFLSHTPEDWIRIIADGEQKYRDDLGLVTFSLIGNHDVWGKAPVSGHSNRQVQQLWKSVHPNLVIMDEPGTYEHPRVPGVRVHALPADFHFDWKHFHLLEGGWNLLVFHDMLQGCIVDVQTMYTSPKGLRIDDLDHSEFDFVLGGDVHIPQRLPFKKTRGGYIGAPLMQSRRDRGDKRGFLLLELSGPNEAVESKSTLVPSPCPRFVDFQWDLCAVGGRFPTPSEVMSGVQQVYGESTQNAIVDLVFRGTRAQLDAMPPSYLDDLKEALIARRVNQPIKQLVGQALLPVVNEAQATPMVHGSSAEEFSTYLRSGAASLDGHDAQRLIEKTQRLLARNEQKENIT